MEVWLYSCLAAEQPLRRSRYEWYFYAILRSSLPAQSETEPEA